MDFDHRKKCYWSWDIYGQKAWPFAWLQKHALPNGHFKWIRKGGREKIPVAAFFKAHVAKNIADQRNLSLRPRNAVLYFLVNVYQAKGSEWSRHSCSHTKCRVHCMKWFKRWEMSVCPVFSSPSFRKWSKGGILMGIWVGSPMKSGREADVQSLWNLRTEVLLF